MSITDIFGLLGGLALFLYGMQMMSSGLEAAAGNKMKQILERLTANRILGVVVGAGITAVIQSSSATTVMVVGFVNSGMMTLRQAVWIIMGANIGTTITGQLIALDIAQIAPVIVFAGVMLIMMFKEQKVHHIGNILAGLGVLFIGMNMMGDSMAPLKESEGFVSIMTGFSNPVFGILAGALFTAVIQSSSASVGILQTLAASGVIPFSSAVYVLFGQNIGTCITALLASVGTNINAKRTTVIHLSFNVIGTILFTILCITTPLSTWVGGLTPDNPAAQLANMHTIFNVVTTLLLLPFGSGLVVLSEKILRGDVKEKMKEDGLIYIQNVTNHNIGGTAIHLEQLQNEIMHMLMVAKENVSAGFEAFRDGDSSLLESIEARENYVDFLNKEISQYISKMIVHESDETGGTVFNDYYKITGNIERISDHAMNISGYSKILEEKKIRFSDSAIEEIGEMQDICDTLLTMLLENKMSDVDDICKISALEQKIDDMTLTYRNEMLARLKEGSCSGDGSIIYSEMLTDFERIGDHALNIAQLFADIKLVKN